MRERNLESLAPVKMETIQQFVSRLDGAREWYHTWTGELYLACHQGTYTAGRNKRHNRLMELVFIPLSSWLPFRRSRPVALIRHPRSERLWKETLLYQFHDILPGSSITRVYKETDERYPAMQKEVAGMLQTTFRQILDDVDTTGCTAPYGVFNTLSWERAEWVDLGREWVCVSSGPLGYKVLEAGANAHTMCGVSAKSTCWKARFSGSSSMPMGQSVPCTTKNSSARQLRPVGSGECVGAL